MKRAFVFLKRRALPIWVGLNVMIAGITVFSGFGGDIDPNTMPFAGLALLTFPAWYLLSAILMVLNLVVCRLLAPANLAALLLALKPFLIFCPLHFGNHNITPEEESRTFKVLSYNTLSFVDASGEKFENNRTMHTILESGADIVALYEYENQGRLDKFVPAQQIDSLRQLYPYFERGGRGTVMYSKRPILHIQPPENLPSKGSIEAFRTQVNGRAINIFAVHLESIGLDNNDKKLYRELTDQNNGGHTDISAVRNQLIGKLYNAFRNRGHQALTLREYAEILGGNTVICGDFNDVPGCRVVKVLEESGFSDVYAAVGCGPTVTFNDPHFFFRIDHFLWRGSFNPVKIERGNVPSSDHYPLLATFVWEPETPTIN